MKTNKAFTLIELLVVVLIIGILTAIAVPQYRKSVAKSQFATLKFLVKDIVQAQEAHYLANNKYAEKFSKLDIIMPKGETNDTYYAYDWGHCSITNYHTQCTNTNINMILDVYYKYVNTNPNQKVCIITDTKDLNDYRNSICKEETGAKTGITSSMYNGVFWYYK